MTRRYATAAMLAALLVTGCSSRHMQTSSVPAGGPAPIAVKPFDLGRVDVLLMVTGGTDGRLEICDCVVPVPGGLAHRSGLIASYRAAYPDSLLIDSGDALVGIETTAEEDTPGLHNEAVLRGYRLLGYDALAFGAQEWVLPTPALRMLTDQAGPMAMLSTTVWPSHGTLPLTRVLERQFPAAKVAVLSCLRRSELLFFPAGRLGELSFASTYDLKARVNQLQRDGWVVIVTVYGGETATEQAAREIPADLLIRGGTSRPASRMLDVAGQRVVKVGGADAVGVVALQVSEGRIAAAEYRLERVDDRWPVDQRLRKLFSDFSRRRAEQAAARHAGEP